MFQPIIPSGGIEGWRFLQRTYDTQLETFGQSAQIQRETDHFRDTISSITSAEDLVADRQLLTVALGAFGLSDDIENRFFIKKMLEEGTVADDALANRFTDTRYSDMVAAFGFGPSEVMRTGISLFTDEIIEKYQVNQFETAAGQQDESMRIALYAQRELVDVASEEGSDAQKWFTIMGQAPLRSLFETALGLPSSVAQIDIDQQLEIFQDRAQSVFGSSSAAQFSDTEKIEDLVTQYLARAQIDALGSGASSAAIALTLLQN
jgi:hypothetical protein